MKTAIKLLLIYFGVQFAAAFLMMIPGVFYSIIKYGTIELENMNSDLLAPTMLLSFVIMAVYLWKAGYINTDKKNWSPVSVGYLLLSALICLGYIPMLDYLLSLMPNLPNIMEQTFDTLQAGWLGILCVAVFGPILEELLFRGAITRALLKKYNPTKAIILSALVFGIFHINPVQVVSATLIGLLLAWIYYKTASLIPCILIHILNNSLSVYMSLTYPEVETTKELFSGNTFYFVIAGACVIFVGALVLMSKKTIPYPWKGEASEYEQETIITK